MARTFRWLFGTTLAGALLFSQTAIAQEVAAAASPGNLAPMYRAVGLGCAAAFAIAICVLGAASAVGRIGAAALGAAAEKPELLTRSILFVALAEGLAVLGFAIAMMILQKI